MYKFKQRVYTKIIIIKKKGIKMATKRILVIGNALVDILTRISDEFLEKYSLTKGAMHQVELNILKEIYQNIGQTIEMSGGSGANSAAAFANLGGKVSFVGNVGDDGFGKIFKHDLKALNIEFISAKGYENIDFTETGRSLVLTTGDSERSMLTYLGAAQNISHNDLTIELLENHHLLYIEGYLWDSLKTQKALKKIIDLAHQAQKEVAFSLSDSYCVDRHRDDFRKLISQKRIKIIFANKSELISLYPEIDQNDDMALYKKMQSEIDTFACITNGKNGSYLITPQILELIPPHPEKKKVVDTTGAGDLYAAGVLYGYCYGFSLPESAALGSFCGSLIIQQMGTRYLGNLRDEAIKQGFRL